MAIDPAQNAAKSVPLTCGPSALTTITFKRNGAGLVAYVSLADPTGADLGQQAGLQVAAALTNPQRVALANIIDTLHIAAAQQLGFA